MIRRLLDRIRRSTPAAREHRPVLLQLHDTTPTGVTVSRAWAIDLADADHIARLLGEPAASWIATAEASEAERATLAAHPGVVITGGQP